MSSIQEIMREFDKKCLLNQSGDCKYWNPRSFGYKDSDKEAPLEKFFPQQIKHFIKSSLLTIQSEAKEEERREVLEEVIQNLSARACAFASCEKPEDVLKSISHMIFKNPMQSAHDFQFIGKAQAYQDILASLKEIAGNNK